MAYGTETIPRVDVICGPGNAYVMEAKRQVYGSVGIDNLAGPSEVLIVADHTARPEWVAADLLAQDEHGSGASAVLMADSEELCEAVRQAVDSLLAAVEVPGSRALTEVAAFYPAAGEDFLETATALVNAYAPEHLEIQMADSRGLRRPRALGGGHLRRPSDSDGLRRLRGRQQPRASHRRSGTVLVAPLGRHLHAALVGRGDDGGGGELRSRRIWRSWPTARASRFTRSRPS